MSVTANGSISGIGVSGNGSSAKGVDIVDPRDWVGFDLTGNNDNSSILQAAIDEAALKTRSDLGFLTSKRLQLPAGRIAFSSPLILKQQIWMEGTWAAQGGTELWFVDSVGQTNSAQSAIANNPGTLGTSMCRLTNFRVEDRRTAPTAGRGIELRDFDNGVILHHLQVMQFPLEQIYVGADSGYAGDCVDIYDIWVTATNATRPKAKGILLERLDNFATVSHIKSDLSTTPANDGYVIRVQTIPNERTIVHISNVKHESMGKCPTLSFPMNTRGNLHISDVTQQQPGAGTVNDAGDVIQIGALAGGSAFAVDGTTMGWTTGATSESGGRLTMENIMGENHGDWTGATGAATVRMLGSGTAAYGPISRAMVGGSGRLVREVSNNSVPNGSIYGNVGDVYLRLDGGTNDCSHWTKKSGNGTNIGWAPMGTQNQSVSYAASVNPNFNSGNRLTIGALTGNVAIQSPTNIPPAGVPVQFDFTQDATGGRTLSWGSNFKGTWPTTSGTASQKMSVFGVSDGTNLVFTGSSGWY